MQYGNKYPLKNKIFQRFVYWMYIAMMINTLIQIKLLLVLENVQQSQKNRWNIVTCFEKEKLSIQLDKPFRGGNVIHEVSKRTNVEAIQIEIPYSLYLHNNTLDPQKSKSLQEKLLKVFLQIEEYYKK